MTKKELTKRIKDYIKDHKELQTPTVFYMDLIKAGQALKIDHYYVMMVLRYGKII